MNDNIHGYQRNKTLQKTSGHRRENGRPTGAKLCNSQASRQIINTYDMISEN